MTEGFALSPGAVAPKRRGRPPGAKSRRPKELAGFLDVSCGGSNALLIARRCMVTLAEVKKAGGDPEAARVAKAAARVRAFDAEAAALDQDLRSIVRDALADLLERAERTEKASAVLALVGRAVETMQLGGGRLTLAQALEAMSEEQLALLPYTDQKQATKVELNAKGFAPVMILDTSGSASSQKAVEYQGTLIDVTPKVSQPKSHDGEEA